METLHSQFVRQEALRRQIMRRVWYAYSLSLLLRPAFVLGFVFGASAIAFWRLASVTNIILNLLNVRLGDVPMYTLTSMERADTFALISFVLSMSIGFLILARMVRALARGTGKVWILE
jgi:hypothetical protein